MLLTLVRRFSWMMAKTLVWVMRHMSARFSMIGRTSLLEFLGIAIKAGDWVEHDGYDFLVSPQSLQQPFGILFDVQLSRLSWKWRKRSSVKIAERTIKKERNTHC